jgi:glyoxylase I family protein
MSAPANPRWSHVGLNCRDQAVTEEFYTRWFGFRRARVVEADGMRVVFLRRGDAYLELFGTVAVPAFETSGDGPAQPGAARHLAFQVDDVDAFLAAAGGRLPVSLGPLRFDRFIPGWKTVWVRDPDGIVVEVSQGYQDQDPGQDLDEVPGRARSPVQPARARQEGPAS